MRALLVVLCALPLFAQTTASLTGVVTDGFDAPFPGVHVTVRSPALLGERTTITAHNGAYVFPALPPGEYTIELSVPNFPPVVRHATLELAKTARADGQIMTAMRDAMTLTVNAAPTVESKPFL